MRYYIQERDEKRLRYNAGSKARKDADSIFAATGAEALTMIIPYAEKREKAGKIKSLYYHYAAEQAWNRALSDVKRGDTVLFQFPVKAHTIRLNKVLEKMKKRGVKTIALIHDLEYIRNALKEGTGRSMSRRLMMEEVSAMKTFERVIAHNEKMKRFLTEKMGIDGDRIVSLEIFDYLIPGFEPGKEKGDWKAVIIAGNLEKEKSGYIYQLPGNVQFELYGANYREEERENVRYRGKFLPDELPGELEGGYGLVWDGPEAATCSGVFGSYLRYNNPHKTSLYLAAGIPVIIWEEAAMAEFIRKEGCGITVRSLGGLKDTLDKISEEEYREMREKAKAIGKKLREGNYTRRALAVCEEADG